MKLKSFFLLFTVLFAGTIVYAQTPENTVAPPSSPANTQSSRGYMFGPGDQIGGNVNLEVGYEFLTSVDENGMVYLPFAKKPIVAQCRTENELREEIEAELKKYLRNPQLNFRIVEKRSRPTVTIYGEIMKPMEITLTRKATLIEILSVAGGPREEASGQIQVFRPKPPMCMSENDPDNWKANSSDPTDKPSRIYSYANVQLGKEDSNPIIYPGDLIVVKKAPPVYVTGQVVGGQGVYLKENGLSLSEVIGMVGGPRPEANKQNIAIYRLKPGSNPGSKDRDLISANLDLIMQGQQRDIMLQPYDIVVVDKAKKPIGVTIAEFALAAGKSAVSAFTTAVPYSIIY